MVGIDLIEVFLLDLLFKILLFLRLLKVKDDISHKTLKFSVLQKVPPIGHESFSGSIENGLMTLLGQNGKRLHLKKLSVRAPPFLKNPQMGRSYSLMARTRMSGLEVA